LGLSPTREIDPAPPRCLLRTACLSPQKGMTALFAAVMEGHPEMVDRLIAAGAQVNTNVRVLISHNQHPQAPSVPRPWSAVVCTFKFFHPSYCTLLSGLHLCPFRPAVCFLPRCGRLLKLWETAAGLPVRVCCAPGPAFGARCCCAAALLTPALVLPRVATDRQSYSPDHGVQSRPRGGGGQADRCRGRG
jgi:hypothetical protein